MSPPRKVAAKSKPSSPSSKAQRKEVEVEEEGETVEILSSTEPSKDVEMTPVELVGEGDEPKVELVAEEEEEPQEEVPAEIKNFEEDSRPRIGEIGKFGNFDATVDTYFGRGGLIGSNSTEGFQYLLSGARSSIGVKGGRGGGGGVFAFEMKIVEILTPMDAACNKQAYLPQNK
ncbi:hypothetical protein Pmar_PMAR025532 [Perkinsus marinus ATCC 50983]|uniref:Uncharacterized protein n=1 Tax=Perkinsus marinus (strain ATCC 50983 / TXsc) TaxID=423536 RepID=C5LZB4_PERM5|nr:hypothetical protein Pmar_PMAR025532 [Perkinsus marinus ATCC 50983]EEQ97908.1 hypothetical protein Pmar_PMAR025532 [Perkinsus marinus ATCC 50983]|eukprot:XP_002765191.1 hypothetical protein Pmar_PMAR025532 [Perkinsus marinus ATCC 50983]